MPDAGMEKESVWFSIDLEKSNEDRVPMPMLMGGGQLHRSAGLEKLVLFEPGTSHFYQGASVMPDVPGAWSIYTHMNPATVIDNSNGRNDRLDVDGVARLLKDAGWKPGQPVEFMGCRSAQGENSIAEQFAKKYGTPTSGATQYMWFGQNGVTGIYGKWPILGTKNTWVPGSMRSFSPGP